MAEETVKAEKKVLISDENAEIEKMSNGAEVLKAIQDGLVKSEKAEVKIEAGKFSGDYIRLSLGEKAVSDSDVIKAMQIIAGGNLTAPADDDGESDDRKPSVVKFFLYGADLAARSRTSQQIKALAQGPEKAIEKMADMIVKNKPGTSRDDALDMARALLA